MKAALSGFVLAIAVFTNAPIASAESVDGAYDQPERVGAAFSFDETVWRRLPSKAGFGLTLSCRLPECRPGEWPGIALCQLAFFPQHDRRMWGSTGAMARATDLGWVQKMRAATMAAPTARRGRVTAGFRTCAARPDSLCMSVALEGLEEPGIGFAFITARNGYRVEGECRFLEPMVERGPALFDEVLKGLQWLE